MTEAERESVSAEDVLGSQLRARRKQLELTLQEVADSAGLSAGFISQVERGLTAPSLSSLVSISRALGAGIADFLSQPSVADSHTRGDQRRPYGIVGESITYERVSSSFAGQQIHSVIMNMPPGYRSERIRHEGEEFEFVLSGSVTSEIEGQTLVLEAGDSVHYRSNRPHCLWNHSCEPARVLWVGTLDLFEEGGGNAGQGVRHSSRSPAEVEPTTREKTHE